MDEKGTDQQSATTETPSGSIAHLLEEISRQIKGLNKSSTAVGLVAILGAFFVGVMGDRVFGHGESIAILTTRADNLDKTTRQFFETTQGFRETLDKQNDKLGDLESGLAALGASGGGQRAEEGIPGSVSETRLEAIATGYRDLTQKVGDLEAGAATRAQAVEEVGEQVRTLQDRRGQLASTVRGLEDRLATELSQAAAPASEGEIRDDLLEELAASYATAEDLEGHVQALTAFGETVGTLTASQTEYGAKLDSLTQQVRQLTVMQQQSAQRTVTTEPIPVSFPDIDIAPAVKTRLRVRGIDRVPVRVKVSPKGVVLDVKRVHKNIEFGIDKTVADLAWEAIFEPLEEDKSVWTTIWIRLPLAR